MFVSLYFSDVKFISIFRLSLVKRINRPANVTHRLLQMLAVWFGIVVLVLLTA